LTIWGVHNDKPAVDFVDSGFVALGWRPIGDLRTIGADREAMKAALSAAYPRARPGAIPVWAGILLRFAFEMTPGDLVVHPTKADSTLNFGRVAGPYRFEAAARVDRHRRDVHWLHTGVPRDAFSEGARYELGASMTLFKVRRHAAELERFVSGAFPRPPLGSPSRRDRGTSRAP
jgi:predicted Mrr-cat superfamily restriction endonuclease